MNFNRLRDLKLARGHSFLASLLTPGGLIIDAGAHRCEFANALADGYGASVISLEPNANLAPASVHPQVTLIKAALAAEDGEAVFGVAANPEASRLILEGSPPPFEGSEVVPTRSLSSLIDQVNAAEVDLLKLDIEGSEYEVLMQAPDEVLLRLKQVSVEFHPHDAKTEANIAPIRQVVNRMNDIGFWGIKCSYRGYGDFLFVNSIYRSAERIPFAPYVRKLNEILG